MNDPVPIKIYEVSPRDGLQNEKKLIPLDMKFNLIKNLIDAGLQEIEVSSFVSPKWVPQLSDARELFQKLFEEYQGRHELKFIALVPNIKGLERALECGVNRIALFTAASSAFTQNNIGQSIEESFLEFSKVVSKFKSLFPKGWLRGYVSTAFECPYAGKIDPLKTFEVAQKLIDLGLDEVSIGDTLGVATPHEVESLTCLLLKKIPTEKLAYHFHDTYGTAIANVCKALELGIQKFDSSAGGLGGCPYAPRAGGNLATEDILYLLQRMGRSEQIDLYKVSTSTVDILQYLIKNSLSKVQAAVLSSKKS